MARGQDLLTGHPGGRPASPSFQETIHCPLPIRSSLGVGGDDVRDGLAMACDGYGLAVFDIPEEFSEVRSGFGSLNLSHDHIPTCRFDQTIIAYPTAPTSRSASISASLRPASRSTSTP